MTSSVSRDYEHRTPRDAESGTIRGDRAGPPRGSLALAEAFLRAAPRDQAAAATARESRAHKSRHAPHAARIAGLIDPDRTAPDDARATAFALEAAGFDLILLGTSVSRLRREDAVARAIHGTTSLPLVLFPGSADHLTPNADALLFLALVSGRDARFLIGEQVRAAPRVRDLGLPAVPTAYILVDGGFESTVQRVTQTAPIARDDAVSLADHALAAEYLGMRAIYLEAGSGAAAPVPAAAVAAVRAATRVPLLVGGGIREPEVAAALARAGADTLVVGTVIEAGADDARLRDLAAAAHGAENAASNDTWVRAASPE